MGRPLSQKLLEKMNIKVSVRGNDKKLVKQVGFNKYETEQKGEIVTLGEDASLLIFRGDKGSDVIKIVRNTLYTNDGFVAEYRIKEEGGIELLDSSLTLSTEVRDGVDVEDNYPSEPSEPSEPSDTPTGPSSSSQDVVDGDDEEE